MKLISRNFLMRFSVLSFVVCALIALGFGWMLQNRLDGNALSQQAQEGGAVVDTLLWPYLTDVRLSHPVQGRQYARLARLVAGIKRNEGDIVRVKIWNPTGRIYFSDDRRIIGRNFGVDPGLRAALAGHTSSGISDLKDPENIDERRLGPQLLQTYVPIRGRGSTGQIIGAYEIYHGMTALNRQTSSIRTFVFVTVGAGFLVLYLSLFVMVRGASRRLNLQARENEALLNQAAEAAALKEIDRLKDEFISVASHELRRPLSSIKGYAATLLLEGDWDESTRRDFLQVIDEESDRLSDLVDNLLDLSRLGTGMLTLQKEPLLLPKLAREIRERIISQPDLPPHQYVLDFPDTFPTVEGDGRRISQVLLNLMENAAKYSEPETTVRISGACSEDGRTVQLAVEDEGIGLSPDDLERIFDRFFRVDNSLSRRTQGTGLGLAISRGVVEAHAGSIWAESTGSGTTIRLVLPAAAGLTRHRDSHSTAVPAG